MKRYIILVTSLLHAEIGQAVASKILEMVCGEPKRDYVQSASALYRYALDIEKTTLIDLVPVYIYKNWLRVSEMLIPTGCTEKFGFKLNLYIQICTENELSTN